MGLHPNYRGHEYISINTIIFEQHAIVGEIQQNISDEAPVIKMYQKHRLKH